MLSKLFGRKKKSKRPTVEVSAPSIQRTRQDSATDATDATDATRIVGVFDKGSKEDIENYMSRHLIQMANPAYMTKDEREAQTTATQFTVREKTRIRITVTWVIINTVKSRRLNYFHYRHKNHPRTQP